MIEDIESQLNTQKRKVDFNSYDITVKELINMIKESIIDIAPEYQRHFRWEEVRQSALIESLLLGIPIPSLFAATNLDGTWELIDGVQRICSIVNFVDDKEAMSKINLKETLTLNDLQKLTCFNNKKFKELPRTIQLSFLLSPLKVTTLSDKSDMDVRFDLFERLNTGGVKLTNQEIRSCIYRGKFNDFLKEMAKNKDFHHVVKLSPSLENDGTREELVLRYFAYLYNYKYFDHSVSDFLNNYMKSAIKKFNYDKNETIFNEVFRTLKTALPNGISKTRRTTPFNLYEAISVGAALAYMKKAKINTEGISEWIMSPELIKYTTGSTNQKSKVINRIEFCKNIFER